MASSAAQAMASALGTPSAMQETIDALPAAQQQQQQLLSPPPPSSSLPLRQGESAAGAGTDAEPVVGVWRRTGVPRGRRCELR